MAEWEVLSREVSFTARRWSVERSIRHRRDDPERVHVFHTIRMPDFVNVVPVTPEGMIVMVRQFRHGAETHTLEMPGGLIDAGEVDPATAARREMIEETGYDGSLAALGTVHPNPALLNNRCYFFVASHAVRIAAPALEETEDAEVVLVPARQIDDLIADGRIANALMIAGLKKYELWRARSA